MATFGDFPPSSSNNAGAAADNSSTWERQVLEDLAFAAL